MRQIFLTTLVAIGMLYPVFAQAPQPEPTLTQGSNNTWNLDWEGVYGRGYFLQHSDDLVNWQYFPLMEMGWDNTIPYGFASSAERFFVRLRITDNTTDFYWGDYDGDGLSNWEEIFIYGTDPFNADTDGDGVPDGAEVAAGTDPNDADSTPEYWWLRVTRSLQYDFDDYPPPNNTGTLTKTAEWDATLNTNENVPAAIPFPDLKARLEQIAFPATPPEAGGANGLEPIEGQSRLLPNPPCYHATMNHHRLWLRRAQAEATAFQQRAFIVTQSSIDGEAQPLTFESTDITIPANETTSGHVDLNKGFVQNFTGNEFHTETFTGRFCPLQVRQTNMPNLGIVPDNTTDLGGQRGERIIGVNGTAFITGEPAMAQLHARFRDMPAEVSVEWRLVIRTERPGDRFTLDDRDIPALDEAGQPQWVTLTGDQEWDITAAMGGEFVGGNCTLHYRLNGGNAGSVTFRLRGKNPLDEDARARIDASVGADFLAYAWAMARHESRQGNRVYNQFNTQATIEGTLNWGGPDGWGIAQIDRRSNREIPGQPNNYHPPDHPGLTPNQYTTTAEVWNWHDNVAAMNDKLVEKQTTYNRFIGYFRDSYGEQENWSEPPDAHTEGNTTLPAEAWGVMVLYNGAGGVPWSNTSASPGQFRSPWFFNSTTGIWTFHDNQNNYAAGPTRVRPELEDTIPTQE